MRTWGGHMDRLNAKMDAVDWDNYEQRSFIERKKERDLFRDVYLLKKAIAEVESWTFPTLVDVMKIPDKEKVIPSFRLLLEITSLRKND